MSAGIFVLCLLASIISTAAPLKCQTCFANKEECKNEDMKLVECGSDKQHCLTLSFRTSMIYPPLSITSKGCVTADQCSDGYYAITSLANKHQQLRTACCQQEGCNTEPLPIPGRDLLKPNGFTCPGSYEQDGRSKEGGRVLCLGDEDQCFTAKFSNHAMSAFHSTISAQGCTTKKTCDFPLGDTVLGNGLLHFHVDNLDCHEPERVEGWNGFSNAFGRRWN